MQYDERRKDGARFRRDGSLSGILASVAGVPLEPLMLWGEVEFGDNVEDEWFIVSLLQRVTEEVDGVNAR